MDEAETIDISDFYKNTVLSELSYPLMEIALNIKHQHALFEPSVSKDSSVTLESTIFKWIDEVCNVCKIPPTPTTLI